MKKILSKKRFLRVCAAIMLFILPTSSAFATGWVDDWVAQKTATSGSYFEGQKRGYYSGGSFSARFPSSNDFPVTIEPPRVKAGCGGIDMFAGGMSFLDFQYLVQKLQKIMMNAGAVAFDLALNTLCPPCSTAIKSFESIANQLNGMQMDDCAAGKSVVATLQTAAQSPEETGKKIGEAVSSFDLGQGVSDVWKGIQDNIATNKGKVDAATTESLESGCNADFKALFNGQGMVLDNIGVNKLGLPQSYIDLIRGLVGDIKVESSLNNYSVSVIAACPDNPTDMDVTSLTSGNAFAKDSNGNCAPITDTNANVNKYVQQQIIAITAKMKNRHQVLLSNEENFIQNSPLSLSLLLKNAIATGRENSVVADISDITARAYVLGLLSDLLDRCIFVTIKAKELVGKTSIAASGADPETCNPDIFGPEVAKQAEKMTDKVRTLQALAKQSYTQAITEHMTILNMLATIQASDQQLYANLAQKYGAGLAKRVIKN